MMPNASDIFIYQFNALLFVFHGKAPFANVRMAFLHMRSCFDRYEGLLPVCIAFGLCYNSLGMTIDCD